jgi:tyrosyl-tRNA synthetase
VNQAKHAGAEVVKQSDNPLMTSLMYPVLQALDEQYLDVDVQFGGVDQRKILVFAADFLPKIGYRKRIHLMNALVPGLSTVALKSDENKAVDEIDNKMSSSNEKTKINIIDTANQIKKKVNSAYCLEGDVLLNKIIFPVLNRLNKPFVIQKPEKFGGETTIYDKYEDVVTAFESKALHPADFKLGIYTMLTNFLEPIRLKFDEPELKTLVKKAYP